MGGEEQAWMKERNTCDRAECDMYERGECDMCDMCEEARGVRGVACVMSVP